MLPAPALGAIAFGERLAAPTVVALAGGAEGYRFEETILKQYQLLRWCSFSFLKQ